MMRNRFLLITLLSLCIQLVVSAQPTPTTKPATTTPTPAELNSQVIPYEKRIKMERIQGVYIPKDLNDAMAQMSRLTDSTVRVAYRKLPEEDAWRSQMFSVGRWLQVNWTLYEGSRISHYLREMGISHPEDQTAFLLIAWHRHLNGKPLDPGSLVKRFNEKRAKDAEAAKKKQKQHVIEYKRKREE
jgi:hypothetical protein